MHVFLFVVFFLNGEPEPYRNVNFPPIQYDGPMEQCLIHADEIAQQWKDSGMEVPPYIISCVESTDPEAVWEYGKTLRIGTGV